MGNKYSTPAGASPSAAFGRLRISDKRVSRRASRAAHARAHAGSLPSSPKLQVGGGGGLPRPGSLEQLFGSSKKIDIPSYQAITGATTEEQLSPLVLRKLESLPSSGELLIASPPFLVWIGPALICALAYALYNIFIKKGSASIHPVLGGVILQFIAAILGSVLLTFLVWKDGGWSEMNYDTAGIQWAILAGIAVGTAEILSFCVSGMGVQAMQSIPIIIGGSVLFGTVLGFVCLHEMLTYRGWLGVGLIATGISLVGIDPGGAGGIHG